MCACVDDSVCACVGAAVCACFGCCVCIVGTVVYPSVGASMCVAVLVCVRVTVCVYTIVVVHASVCAYVGVGANLATSVLNFPSMPLSFVYPCPCVIDYII